MRGATQGTDRLERRTISTNNQNKMKDFDTYQSLALRTASSTSTESERAMLTTAALGLSGESGEIADHVKKIVFHGHPLDDATRDKIAKEIGDILWYCAMGSRGIGIGLGEIAQMNVEKLKKRYPEGFSTENSLNRPHG
jgi:NTP pyrophosphatase (non-canonical NTP hydrolase)